jgi:hypothetical protein
MAVSLTEIISPLSRGSVTSNTMELRTTGPIIREVLVLETTLYRGWHTVKW